MVRISGQDQAATAGSSIAGGFVLVSVAALIAAWRTCQARSLGIGDFRAWLACHELKARRCLAGRDCTPTFTFAELSKLMGVSERRARASARRLVAAGLLEWSESAIAFPDSIDHPGRDLEETLGAGRGSVAIPRRMLGAVPNRPELASFRLTIRITRP